MDFPLAQQEPDILRLKRVKFLSMDQKSVKAGLLQILCMRRQDLTPERITVLENQKFAKGKGAVLQHPLRNHPGIQSVVVGQGQCNGVWVGDPEVI